MIEDMVLFRTSFVLVYTPSKTPFKSPFSLWQHLRITGPKDGEKSHQPLLKAHILSHSVVCKMEILRLVK